MTLAAIATAAVPGLDPTTVRFDDDEPEYSSAVIADSRGKWWRVRAPRTAETSARLEAEALALHAFDAKTRAELPFVLPAVAGTVHVDGTTIFVYSHMPGEPKREHQLGAAPAVYAKQIGLALAALHQLPTHVVSDADLPEYTSHEFRLRKLNELDRAAALGKIPARLLDRWERAFEDVSLWRFTSCIIHGDLYERCLMFKGDTLTAITGWSQLRVADPADDFAWLAALDNVDFVQTVYRHYARARQDYKDPHLERRAVLSAEFALAQWLVRGHETKNQSIVAEAESMLAALEEDIAASGGFPLTVEAPPAPRVSPATLAAPAPSGVTLTEVKLAEAPAQESTGEPAPAEDDEAVATTKAEETAGEPAEGDEQAYEPTVVGPEVFEGAKGATDGDAVADASAQDAVDDEAPIGEARGGEGTIPTDEAPTDEAPTDRSPPIEEATDGGPTDPTDEDVSHKESPTDDEEPASGSPAPAAVPLSLVEPPPCPKVPPRSARKKSSIETVKETIRQKRDASKLAKKQKMSSIESGQAS